MTLEEIIETHAAAGARYAASTGELHDALIELAALDEVLMSGRSGYDDAPNVRTFFDLPQNLAALQHPLFAPADVTKCWREEIKARRNELFAELAK